MTNYMTSTLYNPLGEHCMNCGQTIASSKIVKLPTILHSDKRTLSLNLYSA